MPQRLKSRTVRQHGAVLVSRQRRLRSAQRNRRFSPIALRERPSPDATFYPAGRRSAYNGAAAFRGKLPPKTCLGNPTASRHNGQSSSLGLLPPTDFGGTPTPFGFASRLRRETLSVCVAPPMPAARLRLSGLVATTRLTRRPSGSPVAYGGRPSCSAGLTRYLCRETLIKYWLPPGSPVAYGGKPACSAGFTARHNSWQRWSHQIPLSGNPHQGLAPSGNARRLRRETRSVCVAPPMPAARLRLSGLVATTRLTRRPSGSPVAYGGRPSCSAGLTRYLCRETLIKYWLPPGSPVAYGGKPACSAGLTRYLCRETLIKYWLPPGSPVAYGGKPACSAGFTARHNSWQRWIHRKALLSAQKWHMRETLPQRWTHRMAWR